MKTISDLLCMTLKIGEICISIESSPPNLMEPSLQVILVYLYKSCLILMKSGKYLNTYRQLWLTWIYMVFLWISHDFHRKRKSHDNNTSHFSLCDAGNHTFICQYCKYKEFPPLSTVLYGEVFTSMVCPVPDSMYSYPQRKSE